MKLSLAVLMTLILVSAHLWAEDIPSTFLHTDSDKWNRILGSPVSILTHRASPRESMEILLRQAGATVESVGGLGEPRHMTLDFKDVPLRLALYRIQQLSDRQVSLVTNEHLPDPISILIAPKATSQSGAPGDPPK